MAESTKPKMELPILADVRNACAQFVFVWAKAALTNASSAEGRGKGVNIFG